MKILNDSNKVISNKNLRSIKSLATKFNKSEIYFHMDLDGVTSAIAMREYVKQYGVEVTKYHPIQYGSKEFDVLKPEPNVITILVDFAHGKKDFMIHTDHHDHQSGSVGGMTVFKKSQSNAELISNEISSSNIFSLEDMSIINMIDSADYAAKGVKPQDIVQFFFKQDKKLSPDVNRRKLGFVVNKLILAYKNKPQFLSEICKNSKPSFVSLHQTIKETIKKLKLEPVSDLKQHSIEYDFRLKEFNKIKEKDQILLQYGAPFLKPTGSYDRYTSFKHYPNVDFFIMAWPMGLLQVSFNPFKKKKPEYESIDLLKMSTKILDDYKDELESVRISLSDLKLMNEKDIIKKYNKVSDPELNIEDKFGYRFDDLMITLGDKIKDLNKIGEQRLKRIYDKKFINLTLDEKRILGRAYVSALDLIKSVSGGHKSIANIQGLNYMNFVRIDDPEDQTNKIGLGTFYLKTLALGFYLKLSKLTTKNKNDNKIIKKSIKKSNKKIIYNKKKHKK